MTQRNWSLRNRLTVWLFLGAFVMGVAALFDTWEEARDTADALSDRILAGSALIIAERAALNENGQLVINIPYGALEMLSSAAQDRVFYRIDSANKLITGYPDLPRPTSARGHGLNNQPFFAHAIYNDSEIRLASLASTVSTGIDEINFTVTVAETTQARGLLTQEILIRSALRILAMVVGVCLLFWAAVSICLRPVESLGVTISTRSPDDLSHVTTPVPREVQPLLASVNSLMLRLKSALDGLRNFTGNASHQLRTPLAALRMQLTLAQRAKDLPAAQVHIAKADQALSHADRILAQLLILARVDSADHQTSHLNLTEFLRDVAAEHIPAAQDHGADLGFEAPTAPIYIKAEPLLLSEALHNLISNAVLYSADHPCITIRLREETEAAVIEVEDNGPGIPPEARVSALSRFSRGLSTQPGTGLGLSIVQEIAHLFGGQLTLDHPPHGSGLIARLTFPLLPTSKQDLCDFAQ